ncbi:hypothetical protein FRC07_013678 [Ceratobasidium sp. 392]|nr:hypothetical protein FRC07_013678 [Ceratobasidium sp. 392]
MTNYGQTFWLPPVVRQHDGLQCDAQGLIWHGCRRANTSELQEACEGRINRSDDWWLAQGVVLGFSVETISVPDLQTRIQLMFESENEPEAVLRRRHWNLAWESTAQQLFTITADLIFETIANFIEGTPQQAPIETEDESETPTPEPTPPSSPSAALSPVAEDATTLPLPLHISGSHGIPSPTLPASLPGSPLSRPNALPDVFFSTGSSTLAPALDTAAEHTASQTDNHSVVPHIHNRGGRSDAPNAQSTSRNPIYAGVENFLTRLLVHPDPAFLQTAIDLTELLTTLQTTTSDMPSSASTNSTGYSPTTNELGLASSAQRCLSAELSKDKATYSYFLAQFQFSIWMCRTKRDDFPMLPRSWYWKASAIDSAFPSIPPAPSPSQEQFPLRTVATNFDPALAANLLLPEDFKDQKGSTRAWTEKQRKLVGEALCPATFDEFKEVIQKTLVTGCKVKDRYVYLPASASAHLDTLPEDLRETLFVYSLALFKLELTDIDTKALGTLHDWVAFHLGVWNRYAWTAHKHTGSDELRDRAAGETQSQPYSDHSMTVSAQDGHYELFSKTIRMVLAPALVKLRQYIPSLINEHEVLYHSLNPSFDLGSAPFCMTVVNVQPVTDGHRDCEDKVNSICLILAIAIRSKRDTHFNMDFVGQQMSFVFTSDRGIERWNTDVSPNLHAVSLFTLLNPRTAMQYLIQGPLALLFPPSTSTNLPMLSASTTTADESLSGFNCLNGSNFPTWEFAATLDLKVHDLWDLFNALNPTSIPPAMYTTTSATTATIPPTPTPTTATSPTAPAPTPTPAAQPTLITTLNPNYTALESGTWTAKRS